MSDWQKISIGSLGRVVTGKTPPTANREFYGGDVMFVTPGDLTYGGYYVKDTEIKLSELGKRHQRNQVIPRNAIMFTCIGYTFGKIGLSDEECLTNQQVNSIIVNSENDFRYIYYQLIIQVPNIRLLAGGVDTPIINKSEFEKFKIPIPPLPLQRRIADILSRYDMLIENYQQQISTLESTAQELYREWFVRGRCPYAEHSEGGELPVGWEFVELNTLSEIIQRGISPTYDEDGAYLCLNQRCIRNKSIDYSTGRQQSKEVGKNRIVKFGDVLINSTGEGTLGRTAQIYDRQIKDTTVDSHVTIARPKEAIPVEYYGFIVTNLENYFESMAMGSTGQTELLREVVSSAKVLLPDEKSMNFFGSVTAPMKNKIIHLQAQLITLRQTRDALLPRLLSGQLEVEKDIQHMEV